MKRMNRMPAGDHSLTLHFDSLWRALARHLASRCEKCGKERLFSLFDLYLSRRLACGSCWLALTCLTPLIRLLFLNLGLDEDSTERLLGDSLVRRCMFSVVKGIANFGLKYPQPTGAPITVVWNFTNRCNLNCLHCHQDSSPESSGPELTTSQAFQVIDDMSDAGVVMRE